MPGLGPGIPELLDLSRGELSGRRSVAPLHDLGRDELVDARAKPWHDEVGTVPDRNMMSFKESLY